MLQSQLHDTVRLTSIKHYPKCICLFESALQGIKLEPERKEGKEGGKVKNKKREMGRGEREEDGDKKTDSIEALGYDHFSIRGSQVNPEEPSQTHDLKFRND